MALASLLPPRMADLAAVKYVDEFQWVTGETPMTSWQFLVMIHVVYASALVILTHVMKDREAPKSFVKVYGFIHNIWMSLLSGVMLFCIVFGAYYDNRMSSLESFLCHRSPDVQPGLLQFSMYVFYVSKMMEFIDTFLLVLSKKKLIWLHKIHRLTTMSLVWHAMDARLPAEILCGALNCLVHLIMYFYFAKPIRALRSTITFTQITQFVLVLVALLYAQVLRHQGSACTGTPLAEWHGIIMYGVYLGMFANFFFQQYLRKQANNKKDDGKDGKDEAAKQFASQIRVGGDLLLFPTEVFERDNVAATRIVAKILALGIGGILCFANLPEVVGVPLGVLLMSLSMSWMYIVGQGCSEANFFQNATLNSVVGTLALLPIARPLDVFREPEKGRAWFQRLVSKFFGLTKSHFVVYIFLLAFVPSAVYRFGWGGLTRYWALPLMAMHFNIGTFGAKQSRSVYELLLPGLAPLVIKKEQEPKKKSKMATQKKAREAALKELRNVPLYNLVKGVQFCTDQELEVCPELVQRVPAMQKLWNMLGLQRLMREMLLWKRRDFALHLALAVVGAMLLSSSSSGSLIWFPLLVLFVLSLFNTRATNIARQVVSKARGKRKPGPNGPQEMLIDSKVYDVSDFIKLHPGGSVIKFGLKANATATFVEFHSRSKKARKFLNSLPSRESTAEDIQLFSLGQKTGLLEDFAKMRAEFAKEGLFKPSYSHIAYRLGELLAMHVVGAYMLFVCSSHYLRLVGLMCLGLAQGRCGWLMHEGGHYSLTGNITIDKHIQMLVFGVGCGMSGGWWRNQHNKHHATPQRLKHDVDLDTLPLVAFHSTVAQQVKSPLLKTWLQYQGMLFAPVSTLLVTLGWQLFLHPRHCLRKGLYVEMFWIGLRYALWAWAGRAAGFTTAMSLLLYVAYVYVGGAYIFINFSVSHTHRDVVSEDEKDIDWVRYASNHTTNCTPGLICNWWMSYLNFQIEHHLFPSMPQFNHPSIAPRVKALFQKHGLVYDVRDYWECMRVTFKNLHDVGQSTTKIASETSETSRKSAFNGTRNAQEMGKGGKGKTMPSLSSKTRAEVLGAYRKTFSVPTDFPDAKAVLAAIPKHCFERDLLTSLQYATMSLVLTFGFPVLAWNVLPEPSLQPLSMALWGLFAFWEGTIATGCWVIAHECGHGAFCDNKYIQDSVGFVFHSMLLVPYFSWQRSHAVHHSRTNHLTEGETHVPKMAINPSGQAAVDKFESMGEEAFAVLSLVEHLVFGWPAYLIAGVTGSPKRGPSNHFIPTNAQLFPDSWKVKVLVSDVGLIAVLYGLWLWGQVAGFTQLFVLYCLPYLFVNMWLVLYTWLQHTDIDVPHYGDDTWDWVKGAFMTIDRPYPLIFDFLHHKIGSTHAAHHLCSRLPHYHAREATEAIKKAFPEHYLYDPTPILPAMWRVASKCVATVGEGGDRHFYSYPQRAQGGKKQD